MPAERFVPGHGFIEPPAISRQRLAEFRAAPAAVTQESRRLRGLWLGVEQAMKRAHWGQYADWMLGDSQRSVALRRVFAEESWGGHCVALLEIRASAARCGL